MNFAPAPRPPKNETVAGNETRARPDVCRYCQVKVMAGEAKCENCGAPVDGPVLAIAPTRVVSP